MSSSKTTDKTGPGSTSSKAEAVPAIASQSPVGVLERHVGTAILLRSDALPQSADAEAIFAQPWGHLLAGAAGNREQTPSILLSEFSLGLSDAREFHFETVFETLADAGIRVVAAPFFGSSLVSEAVRRGILLAPLPAETIQFLGERLAEEPETVLTFDLREQRIELPGAEPIAFETHPWLRSRLLFGMDDLDEQIRYRETAKEFRSRDRVRRPWLYGKPDGADSK